jgi:hypothetical protein
MECDYTHLNHSSLLSHTKKVITKGMIIKGVYCTWKNMEYYYLNVKVRLLKVLHLGRTWNLVLDSWQQKRKPKLVISQTIESLHLDVSFGSVWVKHLSMKEGCLFVLFHIEIFQTTVGLTARLVPLESSASRLVI